MKVCTDACLYWFGSLLKTGFNRRGGQSGHIGAGTGFVIAGCVQQQNANALIDAAEIDDRHRKT